MLAAWIGIGFKGLGIGSVCCQLSEALFFHEGPANRGAADGLGKKMWDRGRRGKPRELAEYVNRARRRGEVADIGHGTLDDVQTELVGDIEEEIADQCR